MKKFLLFSAVVAICGTIAFHFYRPDFSWEADASSDESGPIANMDQPLPHAVLPTLSNDWVDLSSFKGKVVLISFWTTWCSGCVEEVPSLIQLQQEYGAKGFTVVAIAVDDQGEESVESFVQTRRFPVNGASTAIDYPVLLGSEEVSRKLGFEATSRGSPGQSRRPGGEDHSRGSERSISVQSHSTASLGLPERRFPCPGGTNL